MKTLVNPAKPWNWSGYVKEKSESAKYRRSIADMLGRDPAVALALAVKAGKRDGIPHSEMVEFWRLSEQIAADILNRAKENAS